VPDVIVVGGGVVGAACALELSRAGATVTLVERDELAAGASGRNNGLWVTPVDQALLPMARSSLARYLELAADAPVPIQLDPEPIGLLAVATDEDAFRLGDAEHEPYRRAGLAVETLDAEAVRGLEPALARDVLGGWLVDHGHRLAPAALTVSLALLATADGATVRHHLPVRSLTTSGDRVTGVVTDDGPLAADEVVVAAGPWTPSLLDPVGVHPPIAGARGWLVRLRSDEQPVRRLVASAGWETATGRFGSGAVAAGRLRDAGAATATLLHPAADGTLIVGSSRQPAISPEAEDPLVPARLLDAAIRLVPSVREAEVLGAWWGVRPMTPDERPLVGRIRPGLSVAAGHGSEGVILAAGTALLLTAQLLGMPEPFDAAPFDPLRPATQPG
jgi:glycine/D-amino acid oxidase-like deaminating enzyme